MGIEYFLTQTATQKRKGSETGSTNEAWSTTVTAALKCRVYPTGFNDTIAFQDKYLRLNITHNMICFNSESISIGDKIIIGSDEYIVKLQPKDWGGVFYIIYLSEVA